MSLISIRPKEWSNGLALLSLIKMVAGAMSNCVFRSRVPTSNHFPSRRSRFRPCVPGIGALAVAVALWGFGYKLSLYHRHEPPSSRAAFAKLWIEPRNACVDPPRVKSRLHPASDSQAFSTSLPLLRSPGRGLTPVLSERTRNVTYFHDLIPLRSPPHIASA